MIFFIAGLLNRAIMKSSLRQIHRIYPWLRRSFHPASLTRTENVRQTVIHQRDRLRLIRFMFATPLSDVDESTKFTPLIRHFIETDDSDVEVVS
jgi:hypothetical protein